MATNHRTIVENFYRRVLSGTTASDLPERMAEALAPHWQSIGDYSGAARTRGQFCAQQTGFGRLIPDLRWEIEELLEAGDRFVVRGRAGGAPIGALFGVPPSGKRFEIMSCDIHTFEGDRIVRTYHVEDWAGAIKQIRS